MQQKQKNHKKPIVPKKLSNSVQPREQTFLEHLYEVRKRVFVIAFSLISVTAIGFQLKDFLISVVMSPLHGQKLIYLTPGGGFSFILTLSIYFGVLVTIPVVMYQIYRFIQPMIKQQSRWLLSTVLVVSTVLAALGVLFGYFVTIPAALSFLANFAGDTILPSLTADSYLNFIATYVLGLALLFQLPLLLFLIDHVNPLRPGTLLSTQNYVVIGATILAALITPTPDVFNMTIVAIPIIAIYELGMVVVLLRHRMRNKHARSRNNFFETNSMDGMEIDQEVLISFIDELRSPTNRVAPEMIKTQINKQKSNMASEVLIDEIRKTDSAQIIVQVRTQKYQQENVSQKKPLRSIDGFFVRGYAH